MAGMAPEEFMDLMRHQLPLASEFSPIIETMEPGRALVRFPFNPRLIRPGATVSGPAIMALADLAMYVAILGEDREAVSAVTTSMTTHFLRPPGTKDILADCEVLRMGKRLITLQVYIYADGEEDPVAHVTGTYAKRSSIDEVS